VVSVLESGAERPGFKSQSRRCRVTVLGKLFTPIVPLFSASEVTTLWRYINLFIIIIIIHQAVKLVAALLRVAGVTAGLAESNGSLPPGL